jgi:mitochondrial fission protein ELM1
MICWVLTDGKQGMESQCVGLARRLGLEPVVKRVRLRVPWRQLSPWPLAVFCRWAISSTRDQLDGVLPDLLIATGRRSVAASFAVRDMSGGRTFRVQIQDPGVAPSKFDLVVVPRHDRLRGDNVMVTLGALHNVTPPVLHQAALRFGERFATLPHPRIAVLVGGSNGAYRLTPAATERLARQLIQAATNSGGSLLVTASRRTGLENTAILRGMLSNIRGEVWDGGGDNPYLGYLAHADAIVVTSDSINMATEAWATGKPVHIFALEGGSAKFRRFHQTAQAAGITRPFDGTLPDWSYQAPDDTGLVADEIRRLVSLKSRLPQR